MSRLAPYTEVDAAIGKYVASPVEDGSTIQLGIGNIPNAVAAELKNKKHLGIHTEMFTETMVDLIECGAVDNSCKGLLDGYSVCSFTMGSQRLYDYIDNNPAVLFKSCTFTNDPYTIGRNNKFVSVNATLEIDLTGQCASETVGYDQWSGTGGQSETVQEPRCRKAANPLLPCTPPIRRRMRKAMRCFDPKSFPSSMREPLSPPPGMIRIMLSPSTELHGLRGLNVGQRARALIAVAHPDFREELQAKAEEYGIW